jgi:hypothetical protein
MATKEEVFKSREKFIEIDGSKFDDLKSHWRKYNFYDCNNTPNRMGQFFLYELNTSSTREKKDRVYYPKLGLYINSLPCDQTLQIEWIDYRRNWEWRTEYDYEYNGKVYKNYIGDTETVIKSLPIWNDTLLIYGVWDSMPNWKQLRQAYERTWWFHRDKDEVRDIQIDRLLK